MIVLKQVIRFPETNSVEATWVDRTVIVVPSEIEGEDPTEQIQEVPVRCHSYADDQMDMLRSDLGEDAATYVDLMAQVESAIAPAPPSPVEVPQVITMRQVKLVLLAAGLLDDVNAVVAAADRATQIEWEYATEVRRTWPTLITLQEVLGWPDDQVDSLFITGRGL